MLLRLHLPSSDLDAGLASHRLLLLLVRLLPLLLLLLLLLGSCLHSSGKRGLDCYFRQLVGEILRCGAWRSHWRDSLLVGACNCDGRSSHGRADCQQRTE